MILQTQRGQGHAGQAIAEANGPCARACLELVGRVGQLGAQADAGTDGGAGKQHRSARRAGLADAGIASGQQAQAKSGLGVAHGRDLHAIGGHAAGSVGHCELDGAVEQGGLQRRAANPAAIDHRGQVDGAQSVFHRHGLAQVHTDHTAIGQGHREVKACRGDFHVARAKARDVHEGRAHIIGRGVPGNRACVGRELVRQGHADVEGAARDTAAQGDGLLVADATGHVQRGVGQHDAVGLGRASHQDVVGICATRDGLVGATVDHQVVGGGHSAWGCALAGAQQSVRADVADQAGVAREGRCIDGVIAPTRGLEHGIAHIAQGVGQQGGAGPCLDFQLGVGQLEVSIGAFHDPGAGLGAGHTHQGVAAVGAREVAGARAALEGAAAHARDQPDGARKAAGIQGVANGGGSQDDVAHAVERGHGGAHRQRGHLGRGGGGLVGQHGIDGHAVVEGGVQVAEHGQVGATRARDHVVAGAAGLAQINQAGAGIDLDAVVARRAHDLLEARDLDKGVVVARGGIHRDVAGQGREVQHAGAQAIGCEVLNVGGVDLQRCAALEGHVAGVGHQVLDGLGHANGGHGVVLLTANEAGDAGHAQAHAALARDRHAQGVAQGRTRPQEAQVAAHLRGIEHALASTADQAFNAESGQLDHAAALHLNGVDVRQGQLEVFRCGRQIDRVFARAAHKNGHPGQVQHFGAQHRQGGGGLAGIDQLETQVAAECRCVEGGGGGAAEDGVQVTKSDRQEAVIQGQVMGRRQHQLGVGAQGRGIQRHIATGFAIKGLEARHAQSDSARTTDLHGAVGIQGKGLIGIDGRGVEAVQLGRAAHQLAQARNAHVLARPVHGHAGAVFCQCHGRAQGGCIQRVVLGAVGGNAGKAGGAQEAFATGDVDHARGHQGQGSVIHEAVDAQGVGLGSVGLQDLDALEGHGANTACDGGLARLADRKVQDGRDGFGIEGLATRAAMHCARALDDEAVARPPGDGDVARVVLREHNVGARLRGFQHIGACAHHHRVGTGATHLLAIDRQQHRAVVVQGHGHGAGFGRIIQGRAQTPVPLWRAQGRGLDRPTSGVKRPGRTSGPAHIVRGCGHIGLGQAGQGVDELDALAALCGVAAVQQQVTLLFEGSAPAGQISRVLVDVGCIEGHATQGDRSALAVGHDLNGVELVVCGQHGADLGNAVGASVQHHDLHVGIAQDGQHRAGSVLGGLGHHRRHGLGGVHVLIGMAAAQLMQRLQEGVDQGLTVLDATVDEDDLAGRVLAALELGVIGQRDRVRRDGLGSLLEMRQHRALSRFNLRLRRLLRVLHVGRASQHQGHLRLLHWRERRRFFGQGLCGRRRHHQLGRHQEALLQSLEQRLAAGFDGLVFVLLGHHRLLCLETATASVPEAAFCLLADLRPLPHGESTEVRGRSVQLTWQTRPPRPGRFQPRCPLPVSGEGC